MQPVNFAGALCALAFLVLPSSAFAICDTEGLPEGSQVVELTLSNGTLCFEMLTDDAPINVANFLWYVENGQFDGSVFHRFLPGFVLQGGDQRRDGQGGLEPIPAKDNEDVLNEPCTLDSPGPVTPGIMVCSERGNERGTVAAAKLPANVPGGGPDSASTDFFINLVDNRENLDNQNGGFTVYARVMGNGMDLVDSLAPPTAYQRQAIALEVGDLAETALDSETQGVGDYTGCFDPNGNTAAVFFPETLPDFPRLGGPTDPRDGSFPYLVSTLCSATPVPNPNEFVASPCMGEISSADQLSIGFDPRTSNYDPFPQVAYYSHSCAAIDSFLDAVDEARANASYQAAYDSQVVTIETAQLIVVPEPASSWLAGAAGLALIGLRRRPVRAHALRPHP
jgi:cyclophilin family peptidyl-prolyl cis-trans isomerase